MVTFSESIWTGGNLIDLGEGFMQNVNTINGDTGRIDFNSIVGLDIQGTNPTDVYVTRDLVVFDDLDVLDDFYVVGTKNAVVEANGKSYCFSAIESPEVWFEEKLSLSLEKGIKEIILDKRFIDCTAGEMHVIATPTSEGTLWVEKRELSIIVHGTCSSFDIVISRRRKDFENIRFDEIIYDGELNEKFAKSKLEVYDDPSIRKIIIEKNKLFSELENENDKKLKQKAREEYIVRSKEVHSIIKAKEKEIVRRCE